jgi:hypothetical protein
MRYCTNIDEVWTGGVGSNIARKNVWFWHSDTDKLMEYRNFWKGWSGGQKTTLEIKTNFAQVSSSLHILFVSTYELSLPFRGIMV